MVQPLKFTQPCSAFYPLGSTGGIKTNYDVTVAAKFLGEVRGLL
jgi:hypothetical protein